MVPLSVAYVAVPVSLLAAIGLIRKIRASQWGQCTDTHSLRGKTFLITGANCGIGLETAKALVKRKARVIFACRDINKAKAVIAEIRRQQPFGGEMIPLQLDLASFESIRNFVQLVKDGFPKIDVLINNAGVAVPLRNEMTTKEGFEINMGVNHLGHFLLTTLLMDMLKTSAPSRIVIVSSTLHQKGKIDFDDLNLRKELELVKQGKSRSRALVPYQNSKLMNAYFGKTLSGKLRDFGVDVHTVCPGFTFTSLFRYNVFRWYHYLFMAPVILFYLRSAKQGSQTVLHCATKLKLEGKTGGFYKDCKPYQSTYNFQKDIEAKLWEVSEEMIKNGKPL